MELWEPLTYGQLIRSMGNNLQLALTSGGVCWNLQSVGQKHRSPGLLLSSEVFVSGGKVSLVGLNPEPVDFDAIFVSR